MKLEKGTKLGHYEIVSQIGAGGMGEVYLAEDTKLDRQVALKVLLDEVAGDADRVRRFIQEAKAASALNHPNILTVFEIGEFKDLRYIATELIKGETLRKHMRGKPLILREILDVALQVAAALDAAHQAGIVHRDIKPENIMLRDDGLVKVLDFGLAKLSGTADVTGRSAAAFEDAVTAQVNTRPGTVMGTVGYMSPEQARGLTVDARGDIWSLGIVIYELLANRPPFSGETPSDTIAAILMKEPPPLGEGIPMELLRIIQKSLQKKADERYQTIKDLLLDVKNLKRELEFSEELERPHIRGFARSATAGTDEIYDNATEAFTVPPSGGIRADTQKESRGDETRRFSALEFTKTHRRYGLAAVAGCLLLMGAASGYFAYFRNSAVLTNKDVILITDFDNKTGDDVFDGTLKQGLAVQLQQSPFLSILPNDRVRDTLKMMNRSADERVTRDIGREVSQRQGLRAMLSGSIASLGRNYVITLEAVNVQTGDVLASEQVEAEGKEQVLRTLGDASTRLRVKLGESLSSIETFNAPLAEATTSSLDALKAYSLGLELNNLGKTNDAVSSQKRAIELDPTFAVAYGALGSFYSNANQPALAAEAATKAFELRDKVTEREKLRIADQYYTLATGEFPKAIEALETCVRTYPRDVTAHINLSNRYYEVGEYEKTVDELLEAGRLNPSSGLILANLANVYTRLNRFEEARTAGEQAIEKKFDNYRVRSYLFDLALMRGDTAGTQQQLDWASSKPGEYNHLLWQGWTAAFAGEWKKARELTNRAAEIADQRNLHEEAGNIASSNAVKSAILGECGQSRDDLSRASVGSTTPYSLFRAGLAFALCGDAVKAKAESDEAVKRYPTNTLVNEIHAPVIRAAIELQQGNRAQAIQILESVRRYDNVSLYYPNYLRGQAFLGERNGAAAALEFQMILNHRGWNPLMPVYSLAHLGLARAARLQGDTAMAQQEYRQFLELWKDADPDLPALIEAKEEYAKL